MTGLTRANLAVALLNLALLAAALWLADQRLNPPEVTGVELWMQDSTPEPIPPRME
jgi:hypothetical protein